MEKKKFPKWAKITAIIVPVLAISAFVLFGGEIIGGQGMIKRNPFDMRPPKPVVAPSRVLTDQNSGTLTSQVQAPITSQVSAPITPQVKNSAIPLKRK
ncbi:MAG: hypothetical protein RBS56_00845 [Candidatus Gracilibacteria bacterium]|jgi:hypothetical protein|nr:hypothetical protein [Candidatus Gracilibacteria bacterium]